MSHHVENQAWRKDCRTPMLYNVIPTTTVSLATVVTGPSITIPLRSQLDLSGAREATLLVKVIDRSFSGTGTPTLNVKLVPCAPVGPLFPFEADTAVLDVDVWGQSGPASFKLYYATATEVGGLVNCVLKYTQYGSAVTNANITLAIDIALEV